MDAIRVRSGAHIVLWPIYLQPLDKKLSVMIVVLLMIFTVRPVAADGWTWAKHTVLVGQDQLLATELILNENNPAPEAAYFAITDVAEKNGHYVISLVALSADADPSAWSLESSIWFGTVALVNDFAGLHGGLEGSADFVAITNGTFYNDEEVVTQGTSSVGGDDGFDSDLPLLPYKPGTYVVFGTRGVHDAGFSLTGWKAVDLVSGSDMGVRYAPNAVYGSTTSEVTFVCRDDHSVAVRAGDFIYAHLQDISSLAVGLQITRGKYFGSMVTGEFNDTCGWASQQPNHWHIHFGFAGTSEVEFQGWTLSTYNGAFVRGSQTVLAEGDLYNYADVYGDKDVYDPRDELSGGASVWDGIIGGVISFTQNGVLNRFPEKTDNDYGSVYTNAAGVILRVFFIIMSSNFKLNVFAFVVIAMLILEPARVIYKLYIAIKRAIPFA